MSEYLTKWEHPSDYGGHSPDGDYVIAGQSRDSSALERSNYTCILKALNEKLAEVAPDDDESVYDFRAGHWACGWVETIILKASAPQAVITLAEEIICALADYPVVDEEHFCELEHDEANEYWANESVSGRIDIIKQSGSSVSIFAARRDYVPSDDSGAIDEWVRG